jgi:sec-independent protein translocase protein TatA
MFMTDYTFAAGNSLMAAGNFGSPWQILVIAIIVLILFGGNRLRNLGGDIGNAIKGFKKAMSDEDKTKEQEQAKLSAESQKIIEGSLEKDKASVDKDPK